jgi:oxalate decarboxylase
MVSQLFFSLESIKPQKSSAGGNLTYVTLDETPGLVNISFASLKLNKGGIQEPTWHPNANKIGYCLQGNALVSIRSPVGVDVFTVEEGDVFFIPKGYVHHLVNVGDRENSIAFALDHHKPQAMYVSQAVASISDSVFSATFHTSPGFSDDLKKSKNPGLIKTLPSVKGSPELISSRFKFNIGASSKSVDTKGGYLQLATKTNLPVLEGLGILGFGLNRKGVVEPHWHTNAGELIYIVKGQTRITVLSPDGHVEVMAVNDGQGAFAPASHFHNIENIGEEEVEVIAFFSHAEPDYIGIGEVIGSYPNEVLASIFNVSPHYFDTFKKPSGPLVIAPT